MFDATIIQKLKRNNISVDAENTMSRVKMLWKKASREQRDLILELSGLTKVSVERVYKTGSISIKLVIAIAQTLNVNPRFLTGESNEAGNCTDDDLKSLLLKHDYSDLVNEQKKADRKAARLAKQQATQTEEPEPENDVTPANDPPTKAEYNLEPLSDENILALINALRIKTELGNNTAKEILAQIQKLLVE